MKTKFKIFIIMLVWICYGLLHTVYYPNLTNKMAVRQLLDSGSSFADYSLYQNMWSYAAIFIIVFTLTILSSELKKVYLKIWGKRGE